MLHILPVDIYAYNPFQGNFITAEMGFIVSYFFWHFSSTLIEVAATQGVNTTIFENKTLPPKKHILNVVWFNLSDFFLKIIIKVQQQCGITIQHSTWCILNLDNLKVKSCLLGWVWSLIQAFPLPISNLKYSSY